MIQKDEISKFETGLNDFDSSIRENALCELCELLELGEIKIKQPTEQLNLHFHTFFSYSGYAYSPSYIAWWAKKEGLFATGIVDFDVLDGVDEFLRAARDLDLRSACGVETRVFIPEFSDKEINSPGEPGVAYHMGVGFVEGKVPQEAQTFLAGMRRKASERTKGIVERVNTCLDLVALDFDKEVIPLAPSGNVTERHVCEAYYSKATEVFKDIAQRAEFWAEKLEVSDADMEEIIEDSVKLQGLIRSKTMKEGGVGYVAPDPESFPLLKDMNEFSKQCGAIPTVAWLNGESSGEADVDALLDMHISCGAAAINIIPDRNWNFPDPKVKAKKVNELNRIIEGALKRDMPVIVGTEANAPGQKLVDDFASDALSGHIKTFMEGAAIASTHTVLQPKGMGYLSEWAEKHFSSIADKNKFFAKFGNYALPSLLEKIENVNSETSPEDLLKAVL